MSTLISTARKQWRVVVDCTFPLEPSELFQHTYGPFKSRIWANIVGWFMSMDGCGCTTCDYIVEEV